MDTKEVVIVTKCSNPEYWYWDSIGEQFLVNYKIGRDYKVWVGNASFLILESDCKLIK